MTSSAVPPDSNEPPQREQTLAGGGTKRGQLGDSFDESVAGQGEARAADDDGGAEPSMTIIGAGTSTPQTPFGRYELKTELGRGAFGIVNMAFDPVLRRKVAIKSPRVGKLSANARRDFLVEARQLAQLNHPGIVKVFDIVADDDRCFIVFDFVEGVDLGQFIKSRQLTWREVADLIAQIADALAHAHSQRTVHRDLKPGNIIVNGDGVPILVDFGLSLSSAQRASGTQLGEVSGTPAYMSPEQASGEGHRIDGRTDIYSLGVILYRMLTGHRPFQARDVQELLRQVREDEPQPPRQIVRGLPAELERICLKAMAKSLVDRYTTADDMASDLRRLLGKEAIADPVAQASKPDPAPAASLDVMNPHGEAIVLTEESDSATPTGFKKEVTSGRPTKSAISDSSTLGSHSKQAQLRQVTVVNTACDVFENPDLVDRLGPEELARVLAAFQTACRRTAQQLGGTFLQDTDCGISVCFGFPQAHEDAGQRAVRYGLAVIDEVGKLGAKVPGLGGDSTLSAGAVAHTETAIVESKSVVEDSRTSVSVNIGGKVRTVVNRLESLAEMGQMLITDATQAIVRNHFECESLGEQRLRGIGGNITLYRIDDERSTLSDSDWDEGAALAPLVGRDHEFALLRDRWEQAVEGMGQVVLLIGEAGLGKSRLLLNLKREVLGPVADAPTAKIIEWRSATHHQNSSLLPVLECFRREMRIDPNEPQQQQLDKLVAYLASIGLSGNRETALLANWLSIPLDSRFQGVELSPQRQKEELFSLLLEWLQELSVDQPLLFIVEDLHWLDPTTLEFLEMYVDDGHQDRVLAILTFRPEFETPWRSKAHQSQIALNRLTSRQVRELMENRAGRSFPDALVQRVIERTDGIPLFVEEFTRLLLDQDELAEESVSFASKSGISTHAVPATLQDMLMARLDRLSGGLPIVQMASAIGREFKFDVLLEAAQIDEVELTKELDKLVDLELLTARGRGHRARFSFHHALLQDAAYGSMLKTQRIDYHGRIAAALLKCTPAIAEQQPELLAMHYTQAESYDLAVKYWEQAGATSIKRRAFKESIMQFQQALLGMDHLPETDERIHREIRVLTSMGVPLQATMGYSAPEVEQSYSRALQLCGQVTDPHERFPILYGMFRYYMLQAKYERAIELSQQLVEIAEETKIPHFLVAAHRARGGSPVYQGRPLDAMHDLRTVVGIEPTPELRSDVYKYDVVDPWIAARSYLSWACWLTGSVAESKLHSAKAVEIASELDHSFSVALAVSFSQWAHQFRHDVPRTLESANAALSLSVEHGFAFWYGWCKVMRGWARGQQQPSVEAILEIENGIKEWRSTGSELGCHYYQTLLAETAMLVGDHKRADVALDNARQFADTSGEGFWLAEIARNRGEVILLKSKDKADAAEDRFREALKIAQQQSAHSLAVRATLALSKILIGTSREHEVTDLLQYQIQQIRGGEETGDIQLAIKWLSSHPIN